MIIWLGNGDRIKVQCIRDISLGLSIGHILELKNIVYVSSMRRNLISKPLFNGFYKIDLELNFANLINIEIGKKKCRINKNSSML